MKLNAQQMRKADQKELQDSLKDHARKPFYLILENVYDTYNIGGLFRLADGLNVAKLYLCGHMDTPPHTRIERASIGTYKVVPWAYFKTVREAIEDICQTRNAERGTLQVVAVEQDSRSQPYTQIHYSSPVALIVGNETFGVLPETLALADTIAEIPMWGINKSLNVIVSAAIVSYHIRIRQEKLMG